MVLPADQLEVIFFVLLWDVPVFRGIAPPTGYLIPYEN